MADAYLVRERIDAGRRLIDGVTAAGVEVAAAFWAVRGDRDRWELYLAVPGVDKTGSLPVYGHVNRVYWQLSEVDQDAIGSFGIRVESATSRLAQAVIDHVRRYPRAAGNRLETTLLGGEYVESLYAYPFSALTPA